MGVELGPRYGVQQVSRALLLAQEGARDSVAATRNARELLTLLESAKESLTDPRGGRLILRVPNLSAINNPPLSTAIVIGAASQVMWPENGTVRGIRVGTTIGTDAASAAMSLRLVARDGRSNLFNDGRTDAYVPFLAINTTASAWYPLDVDVRYNERWDVQMQNEALGSGSIQPFLCFAFDPHEFNEASPFRD